GCLAIAGVPFEANLLGVHRFVGLEIIQSTAGAPRPSPQRTPIIHLARPAFVAQTDDAFGQAGAVVGLNAVRAEDGIAPAFGENLLLPTSRTATRTAEAELHHHRHRTLRVGRGGQRQPDIDGNLRV